MNINPLTAPCIVCHNKGDQLMLNSLRRIKDICDRSDAPKVDIRKSSIRYFQWGIHSRCQYGLPCNELDSFDNECKNIVRHIEERMIQIAMANDNDSEYHNILELLRGDFPAVYHGMERIRAYSKRNITKD